VQAAAVPVVVAPARCGPVESSALEELRAAGRSETTLGRAALALAAKIDAGRDSGMGFAALVARLEVTLGRALEGAERAGDRMDELAARRREKAAGA
jgi:hypothetical protein